MLKTLKQLFDSLVPPPSDPQAPDNIHALQLATAVVLVEVMRADASFKEGELEAIHAALREKFALTLDEAARLTDLAEAAASAATDLFTFTSRIDLVFAMEQKVRIVELMWSVAYADGHLADHERDVLWRVSDLLHVPHGVYMLARQRAREAAGL